MEGLRVASGSRLNFLDQKATELLLRLSLSDGFSFAIVNANNLSVLDDNEPAIVLLDHLRLMREIPVELFFEWAFHLNDEYMGRGTNNQCYRIAKLYPTSRQ